MPERNPPCGRAEALPSRGTSSSAPLILDNNVRSSHVVRSFTLLSRGSGHLATRVSRVTKKEGGGDCNCKLGTQNWPLRGHPFYTSAISAKPTDQDRTLGFLMLQRSFQPSRPGWRCTCIRCLFANCFPDEFLRLLNKAECFTAKRFARTMSYVLICFFFDS